MELDNRDSGDQLNWTTASSREEAEAEYMGGSSYELPELVLQYCVLCMSSVETQIVWSRDTAAIIVNTALTIHV